MSRSGILLAMIIITVFNQSWLHVSAETMHAILKESLHHKEIIGKLPIITKKGDCMPVNEIRDKVLEYYAFPHLQSTAYTEVGHVEKDDDAIITNNGDESNLIFVRRGIAKALVKEDVDGDVLCEHYVLTDLGQDMTVKEMSYFIEKPERRKFADKVYKIHKETKSQTKVSVKEKVESEAEYIFIVKPLQRDQIRKKLPGKHADKKSDKGKCVSDENARERIFKEI
ncbi:hypothetical protein Ddc_17705 [Ditylenchus destructor]|nr:hypothetical protein Ddc_17705 [Ditylenchus destructor]